MKPRFRIRLICLLALLVAPATVHSDTALTEGVASLTETLEAQPNPYDNCQFNWVETSAQADGVEQEVAHCSFRSRDGLYYRIDRVLTSQLRNKSTKKQSRLILSPEGFTLLNGDSEEALAVIVDGTVSEGKNHFYAEPIFEATKRGYLAYLRDVLRHCNDDNGCQIKADDNGRTIQLLQTLDDSASPGVGSYRYATTVDMDSGTVLRWEETLRKTGQIVTSTVVTKSYAGFSIPSEITIKSTGNEKNARLSIQKHRVTSFVPSPAPLEEFARSIIGGPSDAGGSVWPKVVILLVTGFLLLGAYYIYRTRAEKELQK